MAFQVLWANLVMLHKRIHDLIKKIVMMKEIMISYVHPFRAMTKYCNLYFIVLQLPCSRVNLSIDSINLKVV